MNGCFYLGTHMPHWLNDSTVPLFISHRRLYGRKRLPHANTRWALDSGAFSEIAAHGRFDTTPADYIRAIRRYQDNIGNLDWAAPQDHMCEPWILARSHIADTVADAQRYTVDNYLTLRGIDDRLPIIPVLQGQTTWDYENHVAMYAWAGIDLEAEQLVGVGSVCRRQATDDIAQIIATLSVDLKLHGFGVKSDGIARYGWMLQSADSMAWSSRGRRIRPCPRTGLTSCANCRHHALAWRDNVINQMTRRDHVAMRLFEMAGVTDRTLGVTGAATPTPTPATPTV
jgi:hypothetical protein